MRFPTCAVVLAVVGSGVAAPGATATAAQRPQYVALGDSYSSGQGTRAYLDGSRCHRSPHAYPQAVAVSHRLDLVFRACSGATIDDVTGQLDSLSDATRFVTVSVGANDAGFASTLDECSGPSWMTDCTRAVTEARRIVTRELPARWSVLFRRIAHRAPHARIVVVGYPRIFGDGNCNFITSFSRGELRRLNALADLLDARLARAATGAGVRFVNPTEAFTGHAICTGHAWLNGASSPVSESYHPNRAGQAAYARLVGPLVP